jgi:hypothetical protein
MFERQEGDIPPKNEGDSVMINELRDPVGYKPFNGFPRYTVQVVNDNELVGKTYKFGSQDEARSYIEGQREAGFSGIISLRKEPEQGTSDPIIRIDCRDKKE